MLLPTFLSCLVCFYWLFLPPLPTNHIVWLLHSFVIFDCVLDYGAWSGFCFLLLKSVNFVLASNYFIADRSVFTRGERRALPNCKLELITENSWIHRYWCIYNSSESWFWQVKYFQNSSGRKCSTYGCTRLSEKGDMWPVPVKHFSGVSLGQRCFPPWALFPRDL